MYPYRDILTGMYPYRDTLTGMYLREEPPGGSDRLGRDQRSLIPSRQLAAVQLTLISIVPWITG